MGRSEIWLGIGLRLFIVDGLMVSCIIRLDRMQQSKILGSLIISIQRECI